MKMEVIKCHCGAVTPRSDLGHLKGTCGWMGWDRYQADAYGDQTWSDYWGGDPDPDKEILCRPNQRGRCDFLICPKCGLMYADMRGDEKIGL
ncbi:hypothetical protein LCGC14_1399790 [marine sediment metagenome]|uniref:Uncharacterized protein n=1 Tax=marine sediment metagenome TaxID=412755 RepID=A0A0F9JXG5_9ZZZZ